ncbi:MAG: ABC transporter ATP-binding protein [Patescibacteria group bacterium]|nr:ABC transporter ATP-binding protein [Patescibacteria group bacterium]
MIIAQNLTKIYKLAKQKTFKEFLPALFFGKKTTDEFYALKGINFEIKKGESLGILGKNGSGKSTLLKLIAGVTKPSDGRIIIKGNIAPLIELGAGFHPELTGKENVYLNASILGMKKKEVDKLYPEIVDFCELENFMNEPIKHYSSGMYMRLAFAVAVAKRPDILLVDEILAVGDIRFQEKCLNRIKEFQSQGTTLVLVTHNPSLVKDYCQKVLILDSGNQIFFGDAEKGVEKYLKNI